MIVDYFEEFAGADGRDLEISVVDNTTEDGKGWKKSEVRKICAELPTIQGFARSIGIPSTTVKTWAKDHEEFGEAMQRAKDIQYQLLVDRGLTRQYDGAAFAFVAKNITDMRDVQTLAGDPDAPLSTRLVLVDAGSPQALPVARRLALTDATDIADDD